MKSRQQRQDTAHQPSPHEEETVDENRRAVQGAERLRRRLDALGYNLNDPSVREEIEQAMVLFQNLEGTIFPEDALASELKESAQLPDNPTPVPEIQTPAKPLVKVKKPIRAKKQLLRAASNGLKERQRPTIIACDGPVIHVASYAYETARDSLAHAPLQPLSSSTSMAEVMNWLQGQSPRHNIFRGRFYLLNEADRLVSVDCWGHNPEVTDLLRRGEIFSHRQFAKENDFACFELGRPISFHVGDWPLRIDEWEIESMISVRSLQSDPCAALLDRPAGAIWCDFPLPFAGRFGGKLSCDLLASNVKSIDFAATEDFWDIAQRAAPYLEYFGRRGPFHSLKAKLVSLSSGRALCRFVDTELPQALALTSARMRLHPLAIGAEWDRAEGNQESAFGTGKSAAHAVAWCTMRQDRSIRLSDLSNHPTCVAECQAQGIDAKILRSLMVKGRRRAGLWTPVPAPLEGGPPLGVLEILSFNPLSSIATQTVERIARELLGPTMWHCHVTERSQQQAVEHFNHWCLRVDARFRELQREVAADSPAASLDMIGKIAVKLLRESEGPQRENGMFWMMTRADKNRNKVYVVSRQGQWGNKLSERSYEGSLTQRALIMRRDGLRCVSYEPIPEDEKRRSCENVAYPFFAFGTEGAIIGRSAKLNRQVEKYAPYVQFLAEQVTRLDSRLT